MKRKSLSLILAGNNENGKIKKLLLSEKKGGTNALNERKKWEKRGKKTGFILRDRVD
jgi:hypothetical protein